MMSHGSMMTDAAMDPIDEAIDRISACNYKFVQTMCTERKLPANLKKHDMARLIALFDAGAEAELNRLLSSLKETRSRSRRAHSAANAANAAHGGGHSPAYPNYVTTTAEADSASASPDLEDDDEELFSPLAQVDDDGDEDYDPSEAKPKKPRSVKAPIPTSKPCRRSSYDMMTRPPLAASTMGMTPTMAPGTNRRPQHLTMAPAPGPSRMGWPEEVQGPSGPSQVKQAVPGVRRRDVPMYGERPITEPHPTRMSKTGRVIKPRRDGSYVYPKSVPIRPIALQLSSPALPAAASNDYSSSLEWLVNVKSSNIQMPWQLSPYWKPANTNSVNSYLTPISFTSSSSTSSSMFQPYMPPISLYHGTTPNLHAGPMNYARQLQELQIPPSAQKEILRAEHQDPFFGALHSNQGPPPLVHKATNMPMEHYRPATLSPSNQLPVNTFQDHQNWQNQHKQEHWIQETEEQKYHPHQLIKKQHKPMHIENQQKPFIPQQKQKNHHQQFQSMPSSRQTNLQGQERRTIFQGHSTTTLHHPVAPVKNQRTPSISCKSQPTQSQRQARNVPSPHSLHHPHSAYQQQTSCKRQPVYHMQRSSHPTPPDYHQPVESEHGQGPARKRPCYQPSQASQQHTGRWIPNQVSLRNQTPSQSHQIDVSLALPNPDFCKNNEISYPLIYDYLTSAEKQLEPVGNNLDGYPEGSRNEDMYNFPTDLPANQNSFERTASFSSSFIEEVIPSLTEHILHSKQEDVLNSNLPGATLPSPASTPVSLASRTDHHPAMENVCPDNFNNAPQDISTYGTTQQLDFPSHDIPEGRLEDVESNGSMKVQNSPSYSEFAAVIVENVHSIQQLESQNYAELVPVPAGTSSLDDSESHRHMQLRLIKALADPSLSSENNNVTISVPDQIDTTLEKVVKENVKTKQVIFLCSDGTGEPEYMTLSVCQEDALNNSLSSLPGTVPSTPLNSDVGSIGSNEEKVDENSFMSHLSSHPSQVRTIPVTNSDQSTETASSISDYLSQSRSALDTNTKEYLSDENTSAEMTSDGEILDRIAAATSESDSSNSMEPPQVDHLSLEIRDTTLSVGNELVTIEESRQASSLLHSDLSTADNVVPSCSASVLVNYNTDSLNCQVPLVPLSLVVSQDNGNLQHVPSLNDTVNEVIEMNEVNVTDIHNKPSPIVRIEDVNSPESNTEDFECKNEIHVQKDCEVPHMSIHGVKGDEHSLSTGGESLEKPSEDAGELFKNNLEDAGESPLKGSDQSDKVSSEVTGELSLKCSNLSKELCIKDSEEKRELSSNASEEIVKHSKLAEKLSDKHTKFTDQLSENLADIDDVVQNRTEAAVSACEQFLQDTNTHSEQLQDIKDEPMDLTKEDAEALEYAQSSESLTHENFNSPYSTCATDETESILPDVNMNTITPVLAVSKAEDVLGHTSPSYLFNELRDENSRPPSPLLRSKTAGKIYPGKQVRQPVRCSPRQSVRAGPCYAQLSAALVQQKSLPPRVESALQQPAKGRKPCPNSDHGCLLVLPPAQLTSHHLVCEYSFIPCPAIGCSWECIAKKMSAHIREAHRPEIGTGSDSEHTVFFDEIRQQQRLTFLREVSRKLFVICIHAFDNSIFATMQYIASGRAEKPISATGTLEVVDVAGSPHSWRGKIGPIQQRLDAVRDSGNCLQVAPEVLGAIEGATITFHTNIRVSLSQNQTQSSSSSEHSV